MSNSDDMRKAQQRLVRTPMLRPEQLKWGVAPHLDPLRGWGYLPRYQYTQSGRSKDQHLKRLRQVASDLVLTGLETAGINKLIDGSPLEAAVNTHVAAIGQRPESKPSCAR